MLTQTETQKKAAFEAAGLSASQQEGVSAGTGYAPRYSRLPAPEAPETPSYSTILETSRQSEIARQQGQLDTIDTTFKEKLQRETAREKELGAKDVARSNTVSAMTGMVGAPDAATREGNANRRTNDRVALVEQQVAAEKASAIAAIYGRIDQNASQAAQIELQTKREDMERLHGETAKNALNNILSFAEQDNVDWNTFSRAYKDDPDLKSEVDRTGKTLPEIYELYTSTQKAPPKKTYTWKGDNLVVVEERANGTVGTQTFDAKDLGIPKGTDMQTLTVGDSVYWLDKNDPFNADGTPKMTRLGATAKSGGSGSGFTLSAGQKRYDANGKLVASAGNTTQLTDENRRALLGSGLSDSDINGVEADVAEHGIDSVLEGLTNDAQRTAVRKAYSANTDQQFLNEDYFTNLMTDDQMKAAAKEAGLRSMWSSWATEKPKYLKYLTDTVEQYRKAGYSDQEILKMMQ